MTIGLSVPTTDLAILTIPTGYTGDPGILVHVVWDQTDFAVAQTIMPEPILG